MRFINIAQVAGRICRLFGAAFAAPALVAAFYGEWSDIPGFVIGGVVSGGIGQTLLGVSRGADDDLRRIEALSVVAGVWLLFAVLCAIPYLWVGFGVIDALFEAMSGITATGATILTDFETPGRGFFFWRAMTQWIGGMGVITLVVAVLPRLAVGVRQLFFAEAPGPTEEKLAPQIRKTAASLWRLYAGLTAAEVIALGLAGMPWFDAVCHAMTTLAAGGFSPHAQSIMGYDSALIEWIVCLFMFLAGANFALQYRALLGRPGALFRDDEFRAYAGIVALAAGSLALLLWAVEGDGAPLRRAMFQVLSILTTTGYATTDFDLWNERTKLVLLAMMFIGGCAGSAGRWSEGAAAHAGGALHAAGAAPYAPSARRPAGEARRQGRARRGDPLGPGVLPVLRPDVRGLHGGGHRLRGGPGDGGDGHHRHAGQHRTRASARSGRCPATPGCTRSAS